MKIPLLITISTFLVSHVTTAKNISSNIRMGTIVVVSILAFLYIVFGVF